MHDSERTIYHDIVTKCYKTFVRERPYAEFSGEWWSSLIADFDKIRQEYSMTDYADLVNVLSCKLQDQHERRQKEWQKR